MNKILALFIVAIFLFACAEEVRRTNSQSGNLSSVEDQYLWLEDIFGEKSISWVKKQNQLTAEKFENSEEFKELEKGLFKILNSKERVPYVSKSGQYFYNFWKDEQNPRGVWRRTTWEEYKKRETKWEIILDLDVLNKRENENWVWHGAQILRPECKRALISLSRGGADADVVREFDIEKKEFIVDGFQIPEAKGEMQWIDENSVYVFTDFGPGTLTTSGYPRIVKIWKRGTPLEKAVIVIEGQPDDMSVGAYYDDTKGFERHFVYRRISFYESELFLREKDGELTKIDVPRDSEPAIHKDWLLVKLRTPWKVGEKIYPEGSLIAIKFNDFMNGKRDFVSLFEPTPSTSLESFEWTLNYLFLNVLEDVKSRLFVLTPSSDKEWNKERFNVGSGFSKLSLWAIDERKSDEFFLTMTDFITPTTLYCGKVGKEFEKIKELPHFFDSSNYEISQYFATSQDGTKIPYFQVSPKGMKLDGNNVTFLTGYGGFEISELPYYSGGVGYGFLSKGGVYVVANIRGGGEYGPKWHQSAIKENRNRCYQDFAAVAKDLIERGVTSPQFLGIEGGSNGGLLVGNMLTKYPELFGAIVCQVPLLDMKRYSKLLAGASWIAEYGDPDKPEEWEFIKTFSPYHNLDKNKKYPPVLFMTSTRDDRVHPGHARKMAAKMMDMGFDVYYYENIEGGHGGAADNKQAAHMWALAYTFMLQKLNPTK